MSNDFSCKSTGYCAYCTVHCCSWVDAVSVSVSRLTNWWWTRARGGTPKAKDHARFQKEASRVLGKCKSILCPVSCHHTSYRVECGRVRGSLVLSSPLFYRLFTNPEAEVLVITFDLSMKIYLILISLWQRSPSPSANANATAGQDLPHPIPYAICYHIWPLLVFTDILLGTWGPSPLPNCRCSTPTLF